MLPDIHCVGAWKKEQLSWQVLETAKTRIVSVHCLRDVSSQSRKAPSTTSQTHALDP
jgi:hypothetical protein